ncbi:hypothetical protein DXG03_001347, partial [Asterophora parasitica]
AAVHAAESTQQPNGVKKRRASATEYTMDVSMADLVKLYLKLRTEMDKLAESNERMEEEIRELKSQKGTLPPPTETITLDDSMSANHGPSSPSSTPSSSSSQTTAPMILTKSATPASPSKPAPISAPLESPSDLERSLVIARLPIDRSLSSVQQVQADYDQVVSMSALIGYPVLPTAVYRMPIKDPDCRYSRLVKVLMPTKSHARFFLQHWKRLDGHPHFGDVFVRASVADPKERKKTPPSKWNRPLPRLQYSQTRPDHAPASAPSHPINRRKRLDSLMSIRTNPPDRAPVPPPPRSHYKNAYDRQSHTPHFTPSYPMHPQYTSPSTHHIPSYGVPPMYAPSGNW